MSDGLDNARQIKAAAEMVAIEPALTARLLEIVTTGPVMSSIEQYPQDRELEQSGMARITGRDDGRQNRTVVATPFGRAVANWMHCNPAREVAS